MDGIVKGSKSILLSYPVVSIKLCSLYTFHS